jgi:hypothetical protein
LAISISKYLKTALALGEANAVSEAGKPLLCAVWVLDIAFPISPKPYTLLKLLGCWAVVITFSVP